jgi:hypothetical protein
MNKVQSWARRVSIAVAPAVVVAGLMAAPAQAYYDVPSTQNAANGGCLHNQVTHVLTCIAGYPRITRSIYFNNAPHWRNKHFWILNVSAQRCLSTGCWGPIVGGKLIPRDGLPGQPMDTSSTAVYDDATPSDASGTASVLSSMKMDFCMPTTTVCAAPWNWFGDQVTNEVNSGRDWVIYPCLNGALRGFGGAVTTNVVVRFLLDVGAMSKSAAADFVVGPEGAAVITLSFCTAAVANNGYDHVAQLFGQ